MARSGGQHYGNEMYQEGVVDDDNEIYMEGDDFGEDYEEEYVQYSDSSLSAPSANVLDNQAITFVSYEEATRNRAPNMVHHQNAPLYPVRKPQIFRISKTEQNTRDESPYKYIKTPMLREEKPTAIRMQSAHQQSQPMYHVVQQQPSVSYAYDVQASPATSSNSSYNQGYAYATQKTLELKPASKQNKRKALAGQRKPCNCTKSMCLKLYCDCFANGEFCKDCNCKDCRNNLEFEADRTKAIKQSLERNPNAFKPKIGVSKQGASQQDVERLHQKGCHCKKSGCLKNYCECYEAKVPCTDRCKCKGCQNTEADRASRYKDKLPGASLLGALSGTAISSVAARARSGNESDSDSEIEPETNNPQGYPWFYMTDEVIDAATMCMVAQAQEALNKPEIPSTEELEQSVLREFGRCLKQIIDSSGVPSV